MAEQDRDAVAERLIGGAQRYLKIARDEAGSLLPMAAAGFLVLAGIVGGGVDLSRAHKAENRLQAACDAAVLAGRRAVGTDGFDNAVEAETEAYFHNNFDPDDQGASNTEFLATSPDNGNTITATASADVNTTIMAVFGFDSIGVGVTCSASMGVGNSDVTMVLDTTGSMGWGLAGRWDTPTKLSMLQDAMKDFYDTVQAATAGGSARVRYAFVPYSQSVNVGRLLDSSYLVDNMTIQSRKAVPVMITTWSDPVTTTSSGESSEEIISQGKLNNDRFSSRDRCTRELPASTMWVDYGGSSTQTETSGADGQEITTTTETQRQRRTSYTCEERRNWNGTVYYRARYTLYERDLYNYTTQTRVALETVETDEFDHFVYKAVDYDVSRYKTFASTTTPTGDNGNNITSTWDGCIEERQTVPAAGFTYSSATGMNPTGATDLDIDMAPTDDNTRWRPMWPELAYYRTQRVGRDRWGNYTYDLTDDEESLYGSSAPSICPQRAQTLQAMSEDEFDDYADSLAAQGSTYHDIGMIWGARISSPTGIFSDIVNDPPANGGNVARHIIFMTDGDMAPQNVAQTSYGIEFHDRRVTTDGVDLLTARHTSRFLAVCEAAKAKGIRVWVIAFATGLTNELEACASDNSSFTANNASQLNEAFQEIANEVGELRIVQ